MSTAFQRTFGHLVTANAVLNGDPPPPPPLHPAPSTNPSSSSQPTPPPSTDTSIKIIQGRTLKSKSLLNAGVKRSCNCPGRLYTLNDFFHSLGKPHTHPADAADSNAADKQTCSSTTTLRIRGG